MGLMAQNEFVKAATVWAKPSANSRNAAGLDGLKHGTDRGKGIADNEYLFSDSDFGRVKDVPRDGRVESRIPDKENGEIVEEFCQDKLGR